MAIKKAEKLNLATLARKYSEEPAAWKFVESVRWPDGPVCPHCGTVNEAYFLKPQNGDRKTRKGSVSYRRLYKCAACRKPFSVLIGTVMEDSHIPLSKWLLAIHLLCAGKNGVASFELHRTLGIARKSAWHMTQRIRVAMAPARGDKLNGVIEADETYLGGLSKNMHARQREEQIQGRGTVGKTPVVSIVQRGGDVRSQVMGDVNGETVKQQLRANADTQSVLNTDTSPVYNEVGKMFAEHKSVNHGAGEYVRGDATTNTVEGFFGQFKPSIRGTYRHVSQKHTQAYAEEFDFRYNTRYINDGDRTVRAIEQTRGKRLTYRDLVGK